MARPRLCLAMALIATVVSSGAGTARTSAAPDAAAFLRLDTIKLWDGGAPGAKGSGADDTPTLTVFRPFRAPRSSAVIIAPGGAYLGLAADLEGRQVADWFAAHGITAFVLRYRLGPSYPMPVPLEDAKRAIRYVRAHAADYGVDPTKIGFMGFSAGGHLAAMTGVDYDKGAPGSTDPVERVSSRPDFLVLGYPALVMFEAPSGDAPIAYCKLMRISSGCDDAYLRRYRPVLRINGATPPTFLYHTTTDETVPVDDSIRFYRALVAAKVPAEMHLFETGAHGTGLGGGDPALDQWPALLETWLRGRGLFTPAVAPDLPASGAARFSVDTKIAVILADPKAKEALSKYLPVDLLPGSVASETLRSLNAKYGSPDFATLRKIQVELTGIR